MALRNDLRAIKSALAHATHEQRHRPRPSHKRLTCVTMDVLGHRFLYFFDAADGRGKVLYLRHDGDYGLVEPPPVARWP